MTSPNSKNEAADQQNHQKLESSSVTTDHIIYINIHNILYIVPIYIDTYRYVLPAMASPNSKNEAARQQNNRRRRHNDRHHHALHPSGILSAGRIGRGGR